jgi:formate-dependent nitrite reductase membrane component NrfD
VVLLRHYHKTLRTFKEQGLFNALIISYLFFGGAGAGGLVVLLALRLSSFSKKGRQILCLPDEFYTRCIPIILVSLIVGALCLVADIGRLDRILNLLLSPTISTISIGALGLALAILCSVFFLITELFDSLLIPKTLSLIITIIGLISGFTTILYTGILLQSMVSVLFWNTPLITIIFTLSACSTGIAYLFAAAVFTETRQPFFRQIIRIARLDMLIIIAELVFLGLLIATSYFDQNTARSSLALITGDLSLAFWLGLVVCGLAMPLIFERCLTVANCRVQLIWVSAFVLVGGVVLRVCLIGAGAYDAVLLPELNYGLGLMG